jgi:phosphoserine phosphatase RsbU/P
MNDMTPALATGETTPETLQRLELLTDAALAHISLGEMLYELLGRINEALGAEAAAIMLINERRNELVVRAAVGLDGVSRQDGVPFGWGNIGQVAVGAGPVIVADVPTIALVSPLLHGTGVTSLVGAPLVVEGRILGVVHAGSRNGRLFEESDAALLQLAADRMALAIDRERLYAKTREFASTLQRSLLPDRLPEIPGIDVAARYYPAADGDEVGGDFFDVFACQGGFMAVIGDVVGKGPAAAAVTGQARHTLRALARYEREPAALLAALDDAMSESLPADAFVTATCLRLDPGPDATRVTVASAGHPLPLALRADGRVEAIGRHGIALGVTGSTRPSVESDLRSGDSLVLYTDGVSEARSASGLFGEARLSALLDASLDLAADGIADQVADAVVDFQDGRLRDDTALVVIQAH